VTSPALIAARDRLGAWLAGDAFPIWWTAGADRRLGGYHDLLDLAGIPVAGPKRARVQARQAFCYARATEFGWRGPWEAAMAQGLDFLEASYRRADGLFRSVVHGAGEPAGDEVDLYDQAFVLLALAAAARGGEREVAGKAEALLALLPAHPLGGFRGLADASLQANPNMHLLEAALAWMEAGGDGRWSALAEGQARLALDRLIDPASGALSEHFADDWQAPARAADRRVEPGHQFEWAWLLMRWSVLAGEPKALAAALRLIDAGEGAGVDSARGVAIDMLDGELRPLDRAARLWPQTERLKAALLAGGLTGEARFWTMAERAAAGLTPYLEVPTAGLWRDQLTPDGVFVDEPARASSFYHLVVAIAELDRAMR
jgi:mannose/cellobiose epimerase-like protein (N-acyl-D-glucosamine 2-epimerase family)